MYWDVLYIHINTYIYIHINTTISDIGIRYCKIPTTPTNNNTQ
jgi:hypothetical protein